MWDELGDVTSTFYLLLVKKDLTQSINMPLIP